MARSRSERTLQAKGRRRTLVLAAAASLAVILALTAAVWAVGAMRQGGSGSSAEGGTPDLNLVAIETTSALEATATLLATESVPATATLATPVEVPDVTGKPIAEALVILKAAGLVVERRDTTQVVADESKVVVVSQDPSAGTVVTAGTVVLLRVPATGKATVPTPATLIVCIDPGHQAKSDARKEPIGPGATETKARVMGGTTGTTTRLPEYEVTLQIAMNLKARLEAAGITVVMTRTTNDVSISNAERAQVANRAKANLFVRIHCDGSTDPSVTGITTLYPAANAWTARIAAPSKTAATTIHGAVVGSTGAVSRGTSARSDQTGFNWSQVPAITVECGFMTNPVEDKLLASPHYQDKLAQGITNGIKTYLGAN